MSTKVQILETWIRKERSWPTFVIGGQMEPSCRSNQAQKPNRQEQVVLHWLRSIVCPNQGLVRTYFRSYTSTVYVRFVHGSKWTAASGRTLLPGYIKQDLCSNWAPPWYRRQLLIRSTQLYQKVDNIWTSLLLASWRQWKTCFTMSVRA